MAPAPISSCLTGSGYSFLWPEGEYGTKRRVEWGRMSMFTPPMQWWHQHFNPGAEPARYLALKPWGFKYKVEDLKDTGEDVKNGGAQIEYQDQNPEIHQIFLGECKTRGAATAHADVRQVAEQGGLQGRGKEISWSGLPRGGFFLDKMVQ